MATLYKRATPAQARILRAVAGAVKNAADAHPEYEIDEYMARSIAKRACGTLTAQWPDVLAATRARGFQPSEKAGLLSLKRSGRARSDLNEGERVSAQPTKPKRRGPLTPVHRRSPVRLLQRDIGVMTGDARRSGNMERMNALADVLRMLSKITGQS